MYIKYFYIFLITILFTSCTPTNKKLTEDDIINKATKIHNKIFTIDTHADTPLRLTNPNFDVQKRNDPLTTNSKIDLPRMQEGSLDAVFFAVYLGQGKRNEEANIAAKEKALSIFDAIYTNIKKNPEIAEIAFSYDDGYRLEKEGKHAIYMGMENGYPIGTDINNLKEFYDLGARYITLCHSSNNDICDSSTDSPEHDGLSDFGKQVVPKMNDLGMIIDVSHISDKSFYDVIELSKAPVIASHSCARALRDHPRNMDDNMIRKLAENGGVIQMCILSDYVKDIEQDSSRVNAQLALRKKFKNYAELSDEDQKKAYMEWEQINKLHPPKLATVADAVDHIDHIVEIAGIDHVGIGTDFDGGGGLADCFDVSQIQNITIELVKRGYTETEIKKIWGGNFMRVFNEVEQLAVN